MAIKSILLSAVLVLSAILNPAYSADSHPSDKLVLYSAYACVGLADKYGQEGRRFDYEQTKTFISDEVDNCVQVLSWSQFNPTTGRAMRDKFDSDWNRTGMNIGDDQYLFYSNFHRNMMNGAIKAAINEEFREKMYELGQASSLNSTYLK